LVEAVLWMARAGCAWRLVPAEVGGWNSVDKRFARWQEKGVWRALMDHLAADADLEWVLIDSTVVRAHACAAGAKKSKAIRRSADRVAASPASCTLPPTASATRCASP
jgi:transposase